MNKKPLNFFQNMYSKAGKSSYQLFGHILRRTNKSYSIQQTCDSQSISITPNKLSKKPLKQQQPFSQALSREYLHKLQNKGKPNQSIGIYNPKYSAIQKQTIYLLRKSDLGGKFVIEHNNISIKQGNDSQSFIDLSNIKSRRTKGYVDLKRQLSRQQYYEQQNTNLNQFLTINSNQIREDTLYSIKFKRSRSTHYKGSGHSLSINKNNCFQKFYDTNYEEPKINQYLTTFDKQTIRNSIMSKSVCLRDQSIYQYDQFSNTNTNSIISPFTTNDFKKILGRKQRTEQCISNRRRVMIKTINQKILQLNTSTQ